MLSLGLILAFSATAIWAVDNLFQKSVSTRFGPSATSIAIIGGGLIPIVAYMAFSSVPVPGALPILLAVAAGILFGVASLLFYKALETQNVTNAKAIGLIQPVIVLLFSVLILNESITLPEMIGSIVVFIGSFLICEGRHLKFNRKLLPAFYSNLAWAASWILIAYSIRFSNQILYPQLILRAVGLIMVVLIFVLLSKDKKKIEAKSSRWILWIALAGIVGGVLDGIGNLMQSYVVKLGVFYLSGVSGIFGPFIVLVLAYFIYRERLSRIQGAGVLIAAAGALVVALA